MSPDNPKPGPWTGAVLARVVEWQLEFPQGTKEECREWLESEVAAGRVSATAPSGEKRKAKEGGEAPSKR